MIHGQLRRLELLTTVITDPFSKFLPPPLALAQLPSFRLFTFLMLWGSRREEVIHGEVINQRGSVRKGPQNLDQERMPEFFNYTPLLPIETCVEF